jgi:AAA15 family ATPase/GTPase
MDECSFVYIDKFDAFYHYELSEIIINELKKFNYTQIIVTTHNTDLLNNDLMRPDCYFVLTNNKIESLNRLTEKDIRFAHNLQKMFKSGAFNNNREHAYKN